MTASTDAGASRREAATEAQAAALLPGQTAVSCTAAPGSGGLGRHLQEIVSALELAGSQAHVISGAERRGRPHHVAGIPYLAAVLRAWPMLPSSPGVRARAAMVEFDAYAAQRLPSVEHLVAFNGQALLQLAAARRGGYRSTSIVSANPHLRRLARQHAIARRAYPLEGSWATRLVERNVAEYAQADRIYHASEYIRESFLEEGVAAEQLVRFPLTADPRYRPPRDGAASPRFEIVYIGSLSVHKGVPLLIDAVRKLAGLDLRLRLIGGWGTPGMRRFVQRAVAADRRIEVCPGDPLPALGEASLCVHPAYEDGFGYAPAEALAAGVPVIVSADTGMKELIEGEDEGLVLPTGDLEVLTEAIEAAYRREILTAPRRA
jgi:glycosyltransferase involved in cell wall biosynthesis